MVKCKTKGGDEPEKEGEGIVKAGRSSLGSTSRVRLWSVDSAILSLAHEFKMAYLLGASVLFGDLNADLNVNIFFLKRVI